MKFSFKSVFIAFILGFKDSLKEATIKVKITDKKIKKTLARVAKCGKTEKIPKSKFLFFLKVTDLNFSCFVSASFIIFPFFISKTLFNQVLVK